MDIRAKTMTANHCDDGFVHVEVETEKGKRLDITVPAGAEELFLNDYEDAFVEQRDANDRGAAGSWDRGAA